MAFTIIFNMESAINLATTATRTFFQQCNLNFLFSSENLSLTQRFA